MKTILTTIAVTMIFTACSDSKTEVELAKQHILDSINAASNMNRVVDSMNALNSTEMLGTDNAGVVIDPSTGKPVTSPSVTHNADGTTAQTSQGTTPAENSGQSTQADTKENTSTASTGNTTTDKKKMSNKTKGALIGTGAGVIAGAAAGAIISKNDPAKGAAIGGAIGGAVGSGVGFGVGAAKDKKAAQTKTTTPKQ